MEKLTDNEIIKALECCGNNDCEGCPLHTENGCRHGGVDTDDILDLINRQKAENEKIQKAWNEDMQDKIKFIHEQTAEIERLQSERQELKSVFDKLLVEVREAKELYVKDIAKAKSEAYAEFAEKWNIELAKCRNKLIEQPRLAQCAFQIAIATTNDLLKELTEGKKE